MHCNTIAVLEPNRVRVNEEQLSVWPLLVIRTTPNMRSVA